MGGSRCGGTQVNRRKQDQQHRQGQGDALLYDPFHMDTPFPSHKFLHRTGIRTPFCVFFQNHFRHKIPPGQKPTHRPKDHSITVSPIFLGVSSLWLSQPKPPGRSTCSQ